MVTLVKEKGENVETIANEFRCFRKSSLVFSSHRKRLIDRYHGKWVAVYNGNIEAHDSDLESVLAQIDAKGFPRKLVIVRYIEKNPVTMVL